MDFIAKNYFTSEQIYGYVSRLKLFPQLLRRQQEELIVDLVPIPDGVIETLRLKYCADRSLEDVLEQEQLSLSELDQMLIHQEALVRFARQRFGNGLEERFLSERGDRDEVIYSLLRVGDPALARELWIRLEERETTFAEAAVCFGEGPESSRKGLMGPLPIGSMNPKALQDCLRSLRPGQIAPPQKLGPWYTLLRLEQLTPARFDEPMRNRMLDEALNEFLTQRIQLILTGKADQLDSLSYDETL